VLINIPVPRSSLTKSFDAPTSVATTGNLDAIASIRELKIF